MASPEPRHALPLAAVLGLHGLLLFALLQAGVWRDRTAPPRAPVAVTLWLQARPPEVAQPAPAAAPPAARHPTRVPTASTVLSEPAAPLAAVPALEAPAAAALPPEPPAASAPPPPPLRLELPKAAALPRSPALDDPRANRVRPTLEAQIAAALGGDGTWTEERVAEGVIRFRRGGECVEVRETRDVGLDPFNQSVTHKPRQAARC